MDKSHVADAFVISGGRDQRRTKPYSIKQVRRNNRSIQLNRKGFGRSVRKHRYILQPFDRVKYNSKIIWLKVFIAKVQGLLFQI